MLRLAFRPSLDSYISSIDSYSYFLLHPDTQITIQSHAATTPESCQLSWSAFFAPTKTHHLVTTSPQSAAKVQILACNAGGLKVSIYKISGPPILLSPIPTTSKTTKSQPTITMPHSYSNSGSSVEKIYYNPRREARDRKERPSPGRREVEVHNHKRPSEDEARRTSCMSDKRWK